MLVEKDIDYAGVPIRPGVVMAAGESIEILKTLGGVSPLAALAWVLVEWIKSKSSRKIIVQTENKEVVYLEGYSVEDVAKLLDRADNVTVIDTKP